VQIVKLMRQTSKVSFWLGIGGNQSTHHVNNYWMRLSVIASIIKAEVCVLCKMKLEGKAFDTK